MACLVLRCLVQNRLVQNRLGLVVLSLGPEAGAMTLRHRRDSPLNVTVGLAQGVVAGSCGWAWSDMPQMLGGGWQGKCLLAVRALLLVTRKSVGG